VLIPFISDFIVTTPFSFIAEKWGVRAVLWCNLVPRMFMTVWAIVVGKYIDTGTVWIVVLHNNEQLCVHAAFMP
jgi:hypothetical protein